MSTSIVPGNKQQDFQPIARHMLHPSLAHPTIKKWQDEITLTADNLVYPIFVTDQDGAKEEIKALPGQFRWGPDRVEEHLGPLVQKGLSSVLLFGVISNKAKKDGRGTFADDDASPVMRTLPKLKSKFPTLYLACDVCLCGYTDHGHCGILQNDGLIDNPPSIVRLAEIARAYARAGAHCIAPSDMMDGRIHAIKQELRKEHLDGQVSVMSYSAKFASCYYGPFREAAASGMAFGDRTKYQLPPPSRQLALRAMQRDVEEGADILMVKPGSFYLDLVRDAKDRYNLPVAIYQVSGEYAMLYHGAQAGAFSLKDGVMESLLCARRAGANIIISYFTPHVLDWLKGEMGQTPPPPVTGAPPSNDTGAPPSNDTGAPSSNNQTQSQTQDPKASPTQTASPK